MLDLCKIRNLVERLNRWVLGANILLTLLCAITFAGGSRLLRLTEPTYAEPMTDKAEPGRIATLSMSDVQKMTLGKAIFRSGRITQVKVVDELSFYALTGLSLRGESRRAYVRDTKQKKLLVKKVGDTIGSYEVVEIDEQGVHLIRGGDRVLLAKQ